MIVKCAKCGKEFYITPHGWGYMYGGKYTCSYSCMRAMEREDTEMSEKTKRIMTDEDRAKIDELAAQGFDNAAIAEAIGLTMPMVRGYLSRKKRMAERAAAQEAQPEPEGVTVPQALEDLADGKEIPECDELTRMVIRLISDMVAILKKII